MLALQPVAFVLLRPASVLPRLAFVAPLLVSSVLLRPVFVVPRLAFVVLQPVSFVLQLVVVVLPPDACNLVSSDTLLQDP